MRKLSTIQEQVERTFEKAVYDVLLHNGYIPDRKVVGPDPVKAAYQTAAKLIADSKGFCVDLYGHGTSQAKDQLKVPRMVITGLGFLKGDTGQDFGATYEKDENGRFTRYAQAAPFSNYRIQIELTSNSGKQDRLIEAVRQAALPNLSYITHYNEPDLRFLIEYSSTFQRPNLEYGLISKTYVYEVKDVLESESVLAMQPGQGGISPILEIKVTDTEDNSTVNLAKSDSMRTQMAGRSTMNANNP